MSYTTQNKPIRPYFILTITAIVIVNFIEWGRIYKIGAFGFVFLGLIAIGLIAMAFSKK